MAPFYDDIPPLKATVDGTLQRAFAEGQWNSVITLAINRFKQSKDQYYQAVEAVARSRGDNLEDKAAVKTAVDIALKNKTTILDADTLEIYEWACEDDDSDYSKTFGPLRVRLGKAYSQRLDINKMCFEACLDHGDIINAQQIATTLNRSNPANRHMLFLNIFTTYLLSVNAQCPENQKALFATLVFRQIEKTFATPDVSLDEEQILTAFRILVNQGKKDEVLKLLQHPRLGVFAMFKTGHKLFLKEALDYLAKSGEWRVIFNLCNDTLTYVVDGAKHPEFLASDWNIWKLFLLSANNIVDSDSPPIETVEAALSLHLTSNREMYPIYRRTLHLVRVDVAFRKHDNQGKQSTDHSKAAKTVYRYIDDHHTDVSCFDDIRPFFEQLSFEDSTWVLDTLGVNSERVSSMLKRHMFVSLRLRLRYTLVMSPKSLKTTPSASKDGKEPFPTCRFCSATVNRQCDNCLLSITDASLGLYATARQYQSLNSNNQPNKVVDPLTDLTIIGCTCLLRLAGLGSNDDMSKPSILYGVNPQRFLQAFIWLDCHLEKYAPGHVPGQMLLLKLYLLIGCVSRAQALYAGFGIKNVTLDTMGPYMYDRIASMAPGLFRGSPGKRTPMTQFAKYYANSINITGPKQVKQAIRNGHFAAAFDMQEFANSLKHSCALVMAVVEQRRGLRAIQGKNEVSIKDEYSLASINGETELVDSSDIGSVPNHEPTGSTHFVDLISVGPRPSNIRSHLQLQAELFLDMLNSHTAKELKPNKPSRPGQGATTEMVEGMFKLNTSISQHLRHNYKNDGSPSSTKPIKTPVLTAAEASYFEMIEQLSALIPYCVTSPKSEASSDAFKVMSEAIKESLSSQRNALIISADSIDEISTLLYLSSLHALGMLRESVYAVKAAAIYLTSLNDKPSGNVVLSKSLVKDLQKLTKTAEEALLTIKNRIQVMKEALLESGWIDRLAIWAFKDVHGGPDSEPSPDDAFEKKLYNTIGKEEVEQWASKVVDSWRDGVKDWTLVKLD